MGNNYRGALTESTTVTTTTPNQSSKVTSAPGDTCLPAAHARRLAAPLYADPWHLINATLSSRCAPAGKDYLVTAGPRAAATSLKPYRYWTRGFPS